MYVNFIGRIGRVHVQTSARGVMVDLAVAVDGRYVDKQNNNQHDTYWLNLNAYGEVASAMAGLIAPEDGGSKNPAQPGGLIKGALIEGSAVFNRERTYTGKDGASHTTQDFLLTNWSFVRTGNGQGQRQGQKQTQQPVQQSMPQQSAQQPMPQQPVQQPMPQQPVQQPMPQQPMPQQPVQPSYGYPQQTAPAQAAPAYGYSAPNGMPAPAGYVPAAQPAPDAANPFSDIANPFAALGM